MDTEPAKLVLMRREPITFASAVAQEQDILVKGQDYPETNALYTKLWHQSDAIEALTLHHLGLSSKYKCNVLHTIQWLRGGFNVCIRVQVERDGGVQDLLVRCPLAHNMADKRLPGTSEDKLAIEVGTYAWMQENMPHTRIPHLYGLGFRGGAQVRSPDETFSF